jgi:hypothetical protein
MKKLTTFFLAFSLSGCATIAKPDANLCVVNAPAEHLKCYNLNTDYTDDGNLKKTSKAKYFQAKSVYDLNKGVWMSNSDWAEVKKWIRELRKAYEDGKK